MKRWKLFLFLLVAAIVAVVVYRYTVSTCSLPARLFPSHTFECVEKPMMELKALSYDEWSAIAAGTIRIDMPGRKYWEVGISWDGYKLLRNGNIEIKMFEIVDSNRWDRAYGKTPTQELDEIYGRKK